MNTAENRFDGLFAFVPSKGRSAITAFLLLLCVAPSGAASSPDPVLVRAEELYKKHLWTDAAQAFQAHAERTKDADKAGSSLLKAGFCRLKTGDEKGALKLFGRIAGDPAMAKAVPDAVASTFDQMHSLLLKQGKRPAREKIIMQCRKALPGHSVNARIAEREGDALLEAGATQKSIDYYRLAGAGLSVAGTNVIRLLTPSGSNFSLPALTQEDTELLTILATAKPACGLALCDALSKRKEGWRADDMRARIYSSQKKFVEATTVWEAMLKAGKGPQDEIGLVVAETRGFMLGEYTRAVSLYAEWLRRHPKSPLREKAEYQQAGALWMSGDLASAVVAFETFLATYPAGHHATSARETLVRVRSDLNNQLKANSKEKANLSKDPLFADLCAAENKIKHEEFRDALRLLNGFRGRQSHPLWGQAWYRYGQCRRALDEPEKALQAWDEVLRQAALFTNTLCVAECRRAKADVWLEDLALPGKALAAYLDIRKNLPGGRGDPALEQNVAMSLIALERGSEARPILEALKMAEEGDPIRKIYWDNLIAMCEKPSVLLRDILSEERRAIGLLRVADIHFAAERWGKAETVYRKAAKAAPKTETAAFADMQRARCIAHGDKPERALKVYDLFRKEHAKSVWADDALLRAGVLCAGPLGDPDRGAEYFREILASHPNDDRTETAYLYLATLAWWTGKWREAESLHRGFIAKYPDSPFREEILSERLPAIAAKGKTPGKDKRAEQ